MAEEGAARPKLGEQASPSDPREVADERANNRHDALWEAGEMRVSGGKLTLT